MTIKLLMILEASHDHDHEQQTEEKRRKKYTRKHFESGSAIRQWMVQQLQKSERRLNENSKSSLIKMRELRQKLVHSSLNASPLQYLFILFQEKREHLQESAGKIQGIMHSKRKQIVSDLLKHKIHLHSQKKSLQDIKKQLDESLEIMRLHSPDTSIEEQNEEQAAKKKQEKRKQKEQFRKQGYWKEPNEQTQQTIKFIKNIRQKQIKQHQNYKRLLKKEMEMRSSQLQQQELKKKEEKERLKQQLHLSFHRKRQSKQKQDSQNKKKQQQAQSFLHKFRQKPPNYILYSERYKKKEQEIQKEKTEFLQLLKKSKQHSSLQEMKEDIKKFEELKMSHQMEKEEEKRIEESLRADIKQHLSGLYKSKTFQKCKRESSPLVDMKRFRQEQLMKKQMYSKKVESEFAPMVDEQKREELIKIIEELKKKEDHKLRKIVNGEEIIVEKSELNPRKIGLEYLQKVKEMTSLIERKPPPTPELHQKKLVDRSLLKNTFYNRKITISNWKQIMENQNLTSQQKANQLDHYFSMIEEKRVNSLREAKKSDHQRSLSIQKLMDHYQIQKTAAKLALLKSFQ